MGSERNPLPVDDATHAQDIEAGPAPSWTRLDPQVRRLWRFEGWISGLIYGAVFIGGGLVATMVVPGPFPFWVLGIALTLLILVPSLAFVERSYLIWGYRLSERDLATIHGIFWRTERYVARERVQHVDVAAGPIARKLGICKLTVYTAGAMGAVLEIPGIVPEEAERLRRALLPERQDDA